VLPKPEAAERHLTLKLHGTLININPRNQRRKDILEALKCSIDKE
jgi:hypothetical protein